MPRSVVLGLFSRGSRASKEMPELSPASLRILKVIGEHFEQHRRWPNFAEFDRTLYRKYRLNSQLLLNLPDGMVRIVPTPENGVVMPGAEIAMTVAGFHVSGQGNRVLETFLVALRHAADLERMADLERLWEQPDEQPVLSAAEFAHFYMIGKAGRDELFTKVGAILSVEQWGGSPMPGSTAANWSYKIGREVRAFQAVPDIETYLKRRPPITPDRPARPMEAAPPWWVLISPVSSLIIIFIAVNNNWGFFRAFSLVVLVPSAIQVCLRRWNRGHWRDRWLVLNALLAILSGSLLLATFLPWAK